MNLFDYSTAFAIICSCFGQSQKFCEEHTAAYLCSKDDRNTPKPMCNAIGPPVMAGFPVGLENKIVNDINKFRKKWIEGNLAIQSSKYRYGRSVMLMKWNNKLQKQAQVQASYCAKAETLPANLETEFPPGFRVLSKYWAGRHSSAVEFWDEVLKENSEAELGKLKDGEDPNPDDFVFLGKLHLIGCGIMAVKVLDDSRQDSVSTTLVCHLVHGPLSNKVPFQEGNSKKNCLTGDCPEHSFCTKQEEYKDLLCEWDGGGSSITMNILILFAHCLLLWILK